MGAIAEKVVGMDGKPYKVVDGKQVKLRVDGKPKETKSNANEGGTTWVDPIRNKEDIKNILGCLQMKINNTKRVDYKKAYARNKLYFCLGVFTGFRASDLIGARKGTKYRKKTEDGDIYYEYPGWTGLKWQDIYCKDGKTFRQEIAIKELKTSNMRKLPITDIMKRCFLEYVNRFNPDTQRDDYIFVNRQKEKLSCKSIDIFIKDVTKSCGIEGNYSTHSLRKTYVYHQYMNILNEGDEEFALSETMILTGHRNTCDLLRYLGINKQKIERRSESFENYMSDIF